MMGSGGGWEFKRVDKRELAHHIGATVHYSCSVCHAILCTLYASCRKTTGTERSARLAPEKHLLASLMAWGASIAAHRAANPETRRKQASLKRPWAA
jgi:hypothetical protein